MTDTEKDKILDALRREMQGHVNTINHDIRVERKRINELEQRISKIEKGLNALAGKF